MKIVSFTSSLVGLVMVSLPCLVTDTAGCHLDRNVIKESLSLDYQEFDQAEQSGWRIFYRKACYIEAAQLIKKYILYKSGTKIELSMLHFHLGQMYALYGNYSDAILSMKKAYRDSASRIINWNAFVNANIAFLEEDINTLKKQRDLISLQPTITKDTNSMKGAEWMWG